LGPNGIWILFSPLFNKINFYYIYYFETILKLKNFFKILFITFIFIFFIIYFYWFFNNYNIYINLFNNNYNIYNYFNLISSTYNQHNFLNEYNYTFITNLNENDLNNFYNYIIHFNNSKTNILSVNIIAKLLNIHMYAIDLYGNQSPYFTFEEKWIPNIKKILEVSIPIHDKNSEFVLNQMTKMLGIPSPKLVGGEWL